MRLRALSVLIAVFLSTCTWFFGGASHAQQLQLEKILNPVPDYDPFEAPGTLPPKFFPDEVDRRARELLIDTLTNRKDALAEHVNFLKSEDARLQNSAGQALA